MKTFKRIMAVLLIALAGAYLAVAIWMYKVQDKMVFYPQPISQQRVSEMNSRYKYAAPFALNTVDGQIVTGWRVNPPDRKALGVIFYFCGNAEESSNMLEVLPRFSSWSVVLWNYRGYGQSTGTPSEKNIFADALMLYDKFTSNNSVVAVFGRSLGTGVAVYVASQRRVDGVILVSPFDSLVEVGRQSYPFLPVGWLLRSRFDSYSRAGFISAPLLVFVGSEDVTVRPERSYRLVNRWTGPKKVEEIAGADHNTVRFSVRFWDKINDFLNNIDTSKMEQE